VRLFVEALLLGLLADDPAHGAVTVTR